MSDARLTRCPQCQTLFRVTPAQLKKARGKVRCGSCSHVFDARSYLIDEPAAAPPVIKPAPPVKPPPPQPVITPPGTKPPQFIDSIIDDRSRYTNLDKLGRIEIPGEINLPDIEPTPPPPPPAPPPKQEKARPAAKSIYEDTESKEVPPSPDDLEGINIIYEAASQQVATTLPDDFDEEIVLDGGVAAPDKSVQHIDLDSIPDSFLASDLDEVTRNEPEKPVVKKTRPRKKSNIPEPQMPFSLRHSMFEVEDAPRPPWLTSLLVFLMLALIMGLLLQVVLFRSVQLADSFPRLTGTLSWFCARLPCRYSGERDVEQIELVSRDVRSHPTAKNALLINITMQNQARFKQPYPTILLSLSNLGGQVIARRQFTPQEYLDKLYTPFLRMEPDTPVHIALAVIDPGEDAVNFEFSFH